MAEMKRNMAGRKVEDLQARDDLQTRKVEGLTRKVENLQARMVHVDEIPALKTRIDDEHREMTEVCSKIVMALDGKLDK